MLCAPGTCHSLGVCHSHLSPQLALVAGQHCHRGLHEARRFWGSHLPFSPCRARHSLLLLQPLLVPGVQSMQSSGDRNWDVQGAQVWASSQEIQEEFACENQKMGGPEALWCWHGAESPARGLIVTDYRRCHTVSARVQRCWFLFPQVLLRVKESEIQYLKQEISSLKDELQTALRVMPGMVLQILLLCSAPECLCLDFSPFTPSSETIFNFSPECNSIPILVSSVKHSMYQLKPYPTKETVWENIPFSVISPFSVTSDQI